MTDPKDIPLIPFNYPVRFTTDDPDFELTTKRAGPFVQPVLTYVGDVPKECRIDVSIGFSEGELTAHTTYAVGKKELSDD